MEKVKLSEQLVLINVPKLFLPVPLILPPHKVNKAQFLVISFMDVILK